MANASGGSFAGRGWPGAYGRGRPGAYVWPDQGSSAPALPERLPTAAPGRRTGEGRGGVGARPRPRRTLEQARRRAQAGAALRQFLRTALAVTAVFCILAGVVARATEVVRLGYRVDALKQAVQEAQDEHDRLSTAVGRAVDPAKVAQVAEGRMRMTVPTLATVRVAIRPAAGEAAVGPTATESRTVALAPRPAPDRTLWVALNGWFDSWFSGGAVEAQERTR